MLRSLVVHVVGLDGLRQSRESMKLKIQIIRIISISFLFLLVFCQHFLPAVDVNGSQFFPVLAAFLHQIFYMMPEVVNSTL